MNEPAGEPSRYDFHVLKFGGSSLGSTDSLVAALAMVERERCEQPLAVVVSAMGDATDRLIAAIDSAAEGDLDGAREEVDQLAEETWRTAERAAEIRGLESDGFGRLRDEIEERYEQLERLLEGMSLLQEKTEKSRDLVLSFGERIAAILFAGLLDGCGFSAEPVDARDWLITDDQFGEARVEWDVTLERVRDRQSDWSDEVTVHTGFIGRTADGRTTTLGRDGSDYTATLLARALQAEEVEICTDVAGVMTADPEIVDDSYPVPELSYREALELANYGARMFHDRALLPLVDSEIPMRVRSTLEPDEPGTRIRAFETREDEQPTSVASLENLALLDVRWRELSRQAHMARRVLRALEDAGITVWMATEAAHGQAVAVVVPRAEVEAAESAIRGELELELARGEVEPIGIEQPVTLLSLIAEEVRGTEDVAGRFFQALGRVGTEILAVGQGASSRSISCVVRADETDVAVRTVHAAFNFAHQELSLFVLGCGVVGSELLNQIRAQKEVLAEEHDVDVRVVGLADSSTIVFDEEGLRLERWRDLLADEEAGVENTPERIDESLDRMAQMPVPILVDATAADEMAEHYRRAFDAGVHVVTANKKPVTASSETYRELLETARSEHREFHYETTVGASLPVIDTLTNLVQTGDEVHRAEGSLSGTLGYLTNRVTEGEPLSEAVRTAKKKGYTEPRPQDDLSGLDVARKALILARELGMEIELDDVEVEPLVPREFLETETPEELYRALEEFDAEFDCRLADLHASGEKLRYLATVEPGDGGVGPRLEVGPVGVGAEHPASTLRGSEAFVAFHTDRHDEYPLIAQGAGAGGAVTASGVLTDVLRIAKRLQGG